MQEHSFVGHLEELRKRIIYVLVCFVVTLIVSLAFVSHIYGFLIRPAHGMRLAVLGPGDIVQIYLMIAGVAAIVVTTPFILWQLWLFISPGLRATERRYTLMMIGPVLIMFVLGVSFGYFVVFPEIFHFLLKLASQFRVMFTATEYFGFLLDIVLPFGFLFEMPIIILFLTRIGVLTPKFMRKVRRYAYFIFVVLGTLISPPELISHLSVTVPMILVYEVSIWISALAYKKKLAAEKWWREDDAPGERNTETGAHDDPAASQVKSIVSSDASDAGDQTSLKNETNHKNQTGHGELTSHEFRSKRSSVVSQRLRQHIQSDPVLSSRSGIYVKERE